MFFLTPRHVKEGKHYRHALARLIHYKEDILKEKDLQTLRDLLAKMTAALKSRKREQIYGVRDEIEKAVGRIAPPPKDTAWRENVEVFLVAIVVAAGVRAYLLQPFKIPTGSMQPTLYGIVGERTDTLPPNLVSRAAQFVWLGRTYFNLVAQSDVEVRPDPFPDRRDPFGADLREVTYLNFFTFTDIVCTRLADSTTETYRVFVPRSTLVQVFGIRAGKRFKKGEPIVRGYVDTGDQVFVDKMSYNFLAPRRGDVFVFKTTGIQYIQKDLPPGVDSQHYIKRLAGVPGDTLRIDEPKLYINGQIPQDSVFQRVMSLKNGYRGYANMGALGSPGDEYPVPAKSYFALGDNSFFSLDSRFWGTVPEGNIAGRGLFVYWPFSKRWGLIR